MLEGGTNKYKIPHMGKAKLRRAGKLPKNVVCSEEALTVALEKLQPQ